MDPIEQILAQQNSGSANGQGFAQFYAQGVAQNQAQQNINLASQRLALDQQHDATLLPLQADMLRQNIANVGIEAKTKQLQLQSMVEQNSAMPELLDLEMQFAQHPEGYNQQVLTEQLRGLQARYPHAFTAGPGLEMRNNLKAQAMFDMEMAQVNKMRAQARSTNESLTQFQIDPKTGSFGGSFSPLDKGLTEFGKWQQERDQAQANGDTEKVGQYNALIDAFTKAKADSTPQIKNADAIANLNQQIANTTDPAQKTILQDKLSTMQSQLKGVSTDIVTNPDGSTHIVIGPPSDVSAADKSNAVKSITSSDEVNGRLDQLAQNAEGIFGPANAVANTVQDKVLSNLDPSLANRGRIAGKDIARSVIINAAAALFPNNSGRVGEAEMKRVEAEFPAAKGLASLEGSPQEARIRIQTFQQELAMRAYSQSREIKKAPSLETLNHMAPNDLQKEFDAGRINKLDYQKALNSSPYTEQVTELINRLTKENRGRK